MKDRGSNMLRHWQLGIAGIWIAISVCIALRGPLGLNEAAYSERQWMMGLALSLMLAVWNVVRWYTLRSIPRVPASPLKPREAPQAESHEYNPELDFGRMEGDQSGDKGG